jgi:hypothetical protein
VISGGNEIDILNRYTRQAIGSVPAPGAQAVAISREWLAYLAVKGKRYLLRARRIELPSRPGKVRGIAAVSRPAQLGHPSVDGHQVFYTVSSGRGNAIKRANPKRGKAGTVLGSRTAELLNPSAQGGRLLYVRVSRGSEPPLAIHPRPLVQSLMVKRLGHPGAGHPIYSRNGKRPLWTTSLTSRRAFVTVLAGPGPKIISTHR